MKGLATVIVLVILGGLAVLGVVVWAIVDVVTDDQAQSVTVSFEATLVWIAGSDVGFDGDAILYFKEKVPLSRTYDVVFGEPFSEGHKLHGITIANMDGWSATFALVELSRYALEFEVDGSNIGNDIILTKATLIEANVLP